MTDTYVSEASLTDSVSARPARVPGALALVLRFTVYLFFVLALFVTVTMIARIDDSVDQTSFRESGLIEWLQVLIIASTAAVFGVAWRRGAQSRPVMLILALITAALVARELDADLDRLLPVVGWQGPAAACLVGAAWVGRSRWAAIVSGLERWVRSPAFALLWCGAVTTLVFAQLIGQADLWKGVMGDAYDRAFKRVVEESAELFGYSLLLVGALECLFDPADVPDPAPEDDA